MFFIFDCLSAHLQKSEKRRTYNNCFTFIAVSYCKNIVKNYYLQNIVHDHNIYILAGQITGPNDLWFKGPLYSKMFFNTADTHYDVECFEIGGMVQNITNWNKAVSNCASKITFSKVFWWPC